MLFFDLQKQPYLFVCSPFAIANTMAIRNSQSPEVLKYDTKVMRKHLAECLEDKVLCHSPASKRSVKQKTRKSEVIKVYCHCRLPEGGERMIACDNCGEWYIVSRSHTHESEARARIWLQAYNGFCSAARYLVAPSCKSHEIC